MQTRAEPAWIRISWWLCALALFAVLVFHFAALELFNLPTNPISLDLREQLLNYVSPYFFQNWNFFAPHPVDQSEGLLIRARYLDARGGTRLTSWIDVSDPMFRSVAENRLTSMGLIELMLSNAVTDFMNSAHRDSTAQYTSRGHKYYKLPLPASVDPIDSMIMARTGAATLRLLYPKTHFVAIQVAVYQETFPRFTNRFKKDSNVNSINVLPVQWQPYEDVDPFVLPSSIRARH